jgi:hypothetical protein
MNPFLASPCFSTPLFFKEGQGEIFKIIKIYGKILGGKSLNKGRKSDNFFPTFPLLPYSSPSLKRGDTGGR